MIVTTKVVAALTVPSYQVTVFEAASKVMKAESATSTDIEYTKSAVTHEIESSVKSENVSEFWASVQTYV